MTENRNVQFDSRNLRPGEDILFSFKPERRGYMRRNFFMGGAGIPFPFALFWGIIDFGVMIGVPIGTQDYWILAILIPFMAIHALPVWIFIFGVVSGVKDYNVCGHIITSQRFATRTSRKKAFDEFELADISSLSIISSKKNTVSLHITPVNNAAGGTDIFQRYALKYSAHALSGFLNKGLTLNSLVKKDAEKAITVFYDAKEKIKSVAADERYKPFCEKCGGKTENGYCLYCGSRAEIRDEKIYKKR
jgi:hypothetical protein